MMTVIKHHLEDEPPPLGQSSPQDIPSELEEVVHACLAKDPDHRPRSAFELGGRLERVALDRSWGEREASEWWWAVQGDAQAVEDSERTEWLKEGLET